jgi:hypothetical protein
MVGKWSDVCMEQSRQVKWLTNHKRGPRSTSLQISTSTSTRRRSFSATFSFSTIQTGLCPHRSLIARRNYTSKIRGSGERMLLCFRSTHQRFDLSPTYNQASRTPIPSRFQSVLPQKCCTHRGNQLFDPIHRPASPSSRMKWGKWSMTKKFKPVRLFSTTKMIPNL